MGILISDPEALARLQSAFDQDFGKGITPPGVDTVHQRVRSAAIVLPKDQPYKDGAREALIAQPGVAPASV